jgi:DNA-binding MarR family transcriptional regulator
MNSPLPDLASNGLDNSFLEKQVGYNARRASLSIIGLFMERMDEYELSVVDFSVLSLISHNPGVTSRQLCLTLAILPPNFVNLLASLERRGLVERKPHPTDRRAFGLHLSRAGKSLVRKAEKKVAELEIDATSRLTEAERLTLVELLKKVYTGP